MRRIVALVLCMALLAGGLGACARNESVGAVNAPGELVTIEAVQEVMTALDAVFTQAMLVLVRDRRVTTEYVELMAAIFNESALQVILDISRRQAEGARLRHIRPEPGSLETTVRYILSTGPNCVYIQVAYDLTGILKSDRFFARAGLLVLRPLPPGRDVRGVNPTGWVIDEFKIPNDQGAFDVYPCRPPDEPEAQ